MPTEYFARARSERRIVAFRVQRDAGTASTGADQFTYDPLDTHRGENVEGVDPKEKTAAIDQTFALSIGKDGLVYHTDPLPNETPLIGCPDVDSVAVHRYSGCRS